MAARQSKSSRQDMADGLRERPLRDLVVRLKRRVEACGADPEHQRSATERLDFVVRKIGYWEVNRRDMPSLPNMPRFHPRPETGKSYSNIPIPARHRHLFNNRKQRTKKWCGSGHAAWCHYLATVEDEVAYYANPPEAATTTVPPTGDEDDFQTLEELKGRDETSIATMAMTLFRCDELDIEPAPLRALKARWKVCRGYLASVKKKKLKDIDFKTLAGFRADCGKKLKEGKSQRTVNGYLSAFRRVLRLCADYCEVKIPSAYREALRDFTKRDCGSIAKSLRKGSGFGRAEIIPMPAKMLRAWLLAVEDDPLHLALTMCSLNLAAGAADLSELTWENRNGAMSYPCVDLKEQVFITQRIKTFTTRWTTTRNGLRVIPMMKRTHAALEAWKGHREGIIDDLSERRALHERIKRAAKARRLRNEGLSHTDIAAELKTPVKSVADILKQPADRREKARSLAAKGYSLRDIVELTGFSKAAVSGYIRDMTVESKPKPRSNRQAIVTPDPNRIFFVPATGRPLVNTENGHSYMRTIFQAICAKAAIKRETDIEYGRVAPAKAGDFVLPKRNGHYIFRRTAATVAGMLGKVPERTLQNFLGHESPEMTRKYLHTPPSDYEGEKIHHDYRQRVRQTDDPIEAIEEFIEKLYDSMKRS